MELCANRKIGFINGAPYGGGILARGSAASSKYAYATAHPEVMRAVQAMEAACARYDVPLAAAALQFSLRTETVGSTVVGVSSPSRLEETAALADAVNSPRTLARTRDPRPTTRDLAVLTRGVRAG
jgi:D-threo-aldose 1-dehydrogenase